MNFFSGSSRVKPYLTYASSAFGNVVCKWAVSMHFLPAKQQRRFNVIEKHCGTQRKRKAGLIYDFSGKIIGCGGGKNAKSPMISIITHHDEEQQKPNLHFFYCCGTFQRKDLHSFFAMQLFNYRKFLH